MGLFDYFKRRRESLKQEIRVEVLDSLRASGELDSSKRECKEIIDSFGKSVDAKKSGLEARFEAFSGEVQSYKNAVERRTEEQYGMTKDAAERAKKAEAAAKDAAKSAESSAALVKKAEEVHASLEAQAKKVFDDIAAKTDAFLEGKSEELRGVVTHAMSSARDALVELYKTELEKAYSALKTEKKVFLDAHNERSAKLDEKMAGLEEKEKRLFNMVWFMKNNMPHVAYVISLKPYQRELLRELETKYKGNVGRMRQDLETKSAEARNKRNAGLADLAVISAPQAFEEMVAYQSEHKVKLYDILSKIENWNHKRA